MVLQEGRPALSAAAAIADTAHVLLDRPLADLDPELEELATDSLGAPQPPRAAMSRMRSIVSDGSGDAFLGRDRRRQNRRKPARCQRRTVPGWTNTIARRHDDSRRAPTSSLIRSMRWSVGRLLRRRRTLTW
jgi:hypothetical protein